MTTGKRGFTLLEILVVLGILVVLLAVLYQVGGRFVGKTHAQRCMANLREYGIGFIQYTVHHDGEFPPYRQFTKQEDGSTLRGSFWSALIRQYVQGGDSGGEPYPFRCAAVETDGGTHYGMNAGVSGYRTATIRNPGQTLLVGETFGDARIAPGSWEKELVIRHEGRTNLLFTDGHVESRRREQIPPTAEKGTYEYRVFWAGE